MWRRQPRSRRSRFRARVDRASRAFSAPRNSRCTTFMFSVNVVAQEAGNVTFKFGDF